MDGTRTTFRNSALPSFERFELNEVPWWMLCCRVYERSFSLRQVPAQVRLAEVQAAQGGPPEHPVIPPEPMFVGDRSSSQELLAFQEDYQAWDRQRQELILDHQSRILEWQSRGAWLTQRWDLSPVPDLAPFDTRPPEHREWLPVRVMESEGMRSQRTRRISATARNWRVGRFGVWKETLKSGESWGPYTSLELQEMLEEEAYVHLPETLVIVVPGEDFRRFLRLAEGEVLSLVRCRWDDREKRMVQAGMVPLTLVQPALDIVASVAIHDLSATPVIDWPGVPESVERLEGWQVGQRVPVTRVQYAALERWISEQPHLPGWYADLEYRSMAAANLCCSEQWDAWKEHFLWRPLLDSDSGPEDLSFSPTL